MTEQKMREALIAAYMAGNQHGHNSTVEGYWSEAEDVAGEYATEALAQQAATDDSHVTVLPDGSAYGVMSFPLPEDHWLYAPREYSEGAYEPQELPQPILTHALRAQVVAAIRYAVRGATMCGTEADFDPDALVQNAVYALCGPFTSIERAREALDQQPGHFPGAGNMVAAAVAELDAGHMTIGGKYNWKNQPEKLVYLGKKGAWHQFAKVNEPGNIWCEVLGADLRMLEETKPAAVKDAVGGDEPVAWRVKRSFWDDHGQWNDMGGCNDFHYWNDEVAAGRCTMEFAYLSPQASAAVPDLSACFMTAESGGGEYKIVLRFQTLAKMQDAHSAMVHWLAASQPEVKSCGNCHKCLKGVTENGWPVTSQRMILCGTCANKRCPKASDHNLECTGSNEPGQPGSVYGQHEVTP